jgi:hypothetical protein
MDRLRTIISSYRKTTSQKTVMWSSKSVRQSLLGNNYIREILFARSEATTPSLEGAKGEES